VQGRVVIEPPEGGPAEDCEAGAPLPQLIELPNRDLGIRRRPAVLPVPFEKGDGPATLHELTAPLLLVDQDEGGAYRKQRREFSRGEIHPAQPHQMSPRRLSSSQRAARSCLRFGPRTAAIEVVGEGTVTRLADLEERESTLMDAHAQLRVVEIQRQPITEAAERGDR